MSGTNCYPANGVLKRNYALARLRKWNPQLKIWGLSATLGNLDTALSALVGKHENSVLINGDLKKKFVVKTIIPKNMEKFPWAGHLGGKLVEEVAKQIEKAQDHFSLHQCPVPDGILVSCSSFRSSQVGGRTGHPSRLSGSQRQDSGGESASQRRN